MLLRDYHGFNIVSAREETPQPDGDGMDHVVVFRDGSLSDILPTLADAIRLGRAAKERGYLDKPVPKSGEPSHAAQLKGAEPLTAADLLHVGVDADGTIKPIEELSFNPMRKGWADPSTTERPVVVENVPTEQVAGIVAGIDATPAAAD